MVPTNGPQRHRSAERPGCDIAGIKRAVIQHDAMRDRVDVMPDDHLAGWYRRRIW